MPRLNNLLLALVCPAAILVANLQYNLVLTASTQFVPMQQCKHPNYTSSSYGGHVAYGPNYVVENDVWNPIRIDQKLYSCQHNSFYVSASVRNEGGAVESYPSSQYTFSPHVKISKFSTLTSDFGFEHPPTGSGLDYEFAYDIWINGYGGNNHTEVMIWEYNDGQSPAGSKVGTAFLDRSRWVVWKGGKAGKDGGDIITFVNAPRKSGTVNLLDFFHYISGKGWLSDGMNADLWQIDWGAELCAAPSNTVFDFTAFNVKFKTSSGPDAPTPQSSSQH
ncbi:MAG: GH12 family glycosyl hydrolase domain-containing protein [Acidimicrobiales bacterium]